jgi:hypothetical protein
MASLDPDLLRQARELIHNPNFELARTLADNLEHVLNHVRADDVLTVVRAKALADAAVSSFDSARPNPSIYFAQLVSILENATKPPLRQAHELLLDRQFPSRQTTTLARSEPADNIGRGVLPVRTAHLIAFSASLLLPANVRARYRDEFASELHDLAASKMSRWEQTVYAIRLLIRAISLRRAAQGEED